jgi:hypothetical protein
MVAYVDVTLLVEGVINCILWPSMSQRQLELFLTNLPLLPVLLFHFSPLWFNYPPTRFCAHWLLACVVLNVLCRPLGH